MNFGIDFWANIQVWGWIIGSVIVGVGILIIGISYLIIIIRKKIKTRKLKKDEKNK